MPSSSPAISASDNAWRVPRSRPMKPCEFAYTDRPCPACTEAPSELLMPAWARPASSIAMPSSIACAVSMSQGCHRSRSGNAPAMRAASASPAAGSASVWRAIAQACSSVAWIESGWRSAVLAEPLRWPKYTVSPKPRSRVCSTVSTSPRRTFTLSPVSMVAATSAWLAPASRARRITSSANSASRSSSEVLLSRLTTTSLTSGFPGHGAGRIGDSQSPERSHGGAAGE